MIKVINKRIEDYIVGSIYIGRGSPLGNPFTHISNKETKAEFICDSREIAMNCYEAYLMVKIKSRDKVICDELNRVYKKALKGDVYLLCYCKPKSCHGDIIKKIIDSKIILNAIKNK